MKLSETRRQRLLNFYTNAAKIYNSYIGNIYEVHAENHVYKWEFNKKDFLHLCGVSVNLNAIDFFNNCKNSKLTVNNILMSQTKDWNSLKGKAKCLENFQYFIDCPFDTLIIEDLVTSTYNFPVALRNDSKDIAIAFKENKNYFQEV